MSYQRFAAHSPELPTLTCGAIEETDATMREMIGVDLELRQLGDGPFRSDLAMARHGETVFYWQRFNRGIQTVLHPPEGLEALVLPVHDGGEIHLSGDSLSGWELLVLPKGSEADVVSSVRSGVDCILLPEGRLEELLEISCPELRRPWPRKATIVTGNPTRHRAIRRSLLDLMAHAGERKRESVDRLLAEAGAWLGDPSSCWRLEGSAINQTCRRVAKRAQQFIEERFRSTVRLEELCRATGVAMRSLQRSFHDYFNLTITDYLKAARLNGARRDLVAADPGSTTVSAIARNNGFPHPGRFSVEFRKRFGECPRAVFAR